MKKYIIWYVVLGAVLLILGLTHGIPLGIVIAQIDENYGIMPKISQHIVLIYNIVIMLGCLAGSILIARKKDNKFKLRWLMPVVMIVSFVFLPVGMSKHMCIAPRETIYEFWSLFSLAGR